MNKSKKTAIYKVQFQIYIRQPWPHSTNDISRISKPTKKYNDVILMEKLIWLSTWTHIKMRETAKGQSSFVTWVNDFPTLTAFSSSRNLLAWIYFHLSSPCKASSLLLLNFNLSLLSRNSLTWSISHYSLLNLLQLATTSVTKHTVLRYYSSNILL